MYLLVLFVVFLLSKALWVNMELAGEFRNGTVSINSVIILYKNNSNFALTHTHHTYSDVHAKKYGQADGIIGRERVLFFRSIFSTH